MSKRLKKLENKAQGTFEKVEELGKDVRDYINNNAQSDIDMVLEKAKEHAADVKEVFSENSNQYLNGEDSGLNIEDL